MRGAPPVQMACGPDAPWRWFNKALLVLAACALASWFTLQWAKGWPWVATTVALTAVLAGLAADGLDPPTSTAQPLIWDGQCWSWQGLPGDVSVMLDFGRWVLIRVTTAEHRHWVPISLTPATATTNLFRAALLAHAGRARHGDDRA